MMGKGALELYSTQEELELILDRIWSTKVDQHDYGDGKTDFTEFLVAMNRIIEEHNDPNNHEVHLPDVPLDKLQTKQMKVGFGGTTWRKAEDATWILTNCGVIAVCGLLMSAVIYFRFMLVPMTMAYFLTFVLGPIIDFVSQRPLVCLGHVYCKIKKLPREQAKVEWEKKCREEKWGKRPLPHTTDIDYPYEEATGRCCHAVPPTETQGTLAELIAVGQLPFPLALTMMFLIVVFTLYTVFAFVQRDISVVMEDPIFVRNLKDVLDELFKYLERDIGVILDVNTEELLPPPCFPDNDEWVEKFPTYAQGCERMSNISAVRFEGSVDEFLVFMEPYIALANDWILTIMLCLYLLAARSGRTEYDHHRAKHAVGELSIMEKIEVMNKNYVLLKTKLSALTGVAVGIILALLSVKLWFIWGLLTFMFNFIPNVGSMVAMLLPIPIIIVDEELTLWPKLLAFFLPATVQLYVGNVLEPMVFGKSLNLTALSVLVALVLWSSIWGASPITVHRRPSARPAVCVSYASLVASHLCSSSSHLCSSSSSSSSSPHLCVYESIDRYVGRDPVGPSAGCDEDLA
jgi:predicted PurR-regulated permease PerM